METPCIGKCQLDQADVCMGCRRTKDQISAWYFMTDEQREEIMNELDRRRFDEGSL